MLGFFSSFVVLAMLEAAYFQSPVAQFTLDLQHLQLRSGVVHRSHVFCKPGNLSLANCLSDVVVVANRKEASLICIRRTQKDRALIGQSGDKWRKCHKRTCRNPGDASRSGYI